MPCHYGAAYHATISSKGKAKDGARWTKQVHAIRALKSGGTLLDIGCNSGAFLGKMDRRSWALYGIEIDTQQAAVARQTTGADVFSGDLLQAPFKTSTFDVITMFHVLEHLDNPTKKLARLYEWLKPEGILYIGLPNIDSWESAIFASYWFGLELPRHLHHYSPMSLRKMLTGQGFQEVWLRTPGSYATQSMHYVLQKQAERIGISPVPLAAGKSLPLAMRFLAKAFRLGVGSPFAKLSEAAGKGANVEAIFQKR